MRLLVALLLSGCVSDGHGGYGTRWMAEQWAKADRDGSLECVAASGHANALCMWDAKHKQCACSVPLDGSAEGLGPDRKMAHEMAFNPCAYVVR